MAVLKITKRAIDALVAPSDRDAYYWDSAKDPIGFGVRVTPKGVKSFVFQYRIKGHAARRVTLGKYGTLTPEQARALARDHAFSVAAGFDPVEVQKRKARDARNLGFAGYIDRFSEGCLKVEWPDSWEQAKRTLERHALPVLKNKPLTAITPDDIKDVIDPLRNRKPLARKVWAVLSRLFSWATEERDLPMNGNPMTGVRAPGTPDARKRVLSPDEIVAAWNASFHLHGPWGPFVRLLFATLQRRNEVSGLPWKELNKDDALWHIDAARVKNDEDHLVPLNSLAMDEFDAIGWKSRGLVLTTTGKTPVSGFSRMKKQLDKHMTAILQNAENERAEAVGEDPEMVSLDRWTLHDIRRTGTTMMQSLGIPVEVTERCLNHAAGETREGIRGVYNLWKYEPEKRRAFDAWGEYLNRLIAPAETTNVVSLLGAGGR